jgi:hypothetical protein
VGPRAVLDAVVKRKIPIPLRESNPRTPIVQPIAQRYTTDLIEHRKIMRILSKFCVFFGMKNHSMETVRKLYPAFRFMAITMDYWSWESGDNKHTHKFSLNNCYVLKITNVARVRNFELLS